MKTEPTSKYRRAYGMTERQIAAKLKCSVSLVERLHRRRKLRAILEGRKPVPRSPIIPLDEQRRIASSRRAEEARKITAHVKEPASQTLREVRAGNYIAAQK